MASGQDGAFLPYVHRLFHQGSLAGLGEGQLLERFVSRRDEAAFEALVARHGPMVLAVCRRLLHDERDVEDAFQATFLILVRRAASIQERALLGNWLYGVAHRVAVRARQHAARQRLFEKAGLEMDLAAEPAAGEQPEEAALLLDEVRRLPEHYRAAVVLCHLEGLTHEQAATHLRCPVGTVRSRLARARALLRTRLTRRGVAVSAGAISAMLGTQKAVAAVPTILLDSTVRAACQSAAVSAAAAGTVPATAAALAEGVVKTMFLSKLKLVVASLFVIGAVAAGSGLAGYALGDGRADAALRRAMAAAQGPGGGSSPSTDPAADAASRAVQARLSGSINDVQKLDALVSELEEKLNDPERTKPLRVILERLERELTASRSDLELASAARSAAAGRPAGAPPTPDDVQRALKQANAAAGRFSPGDAVWVEVLEALPGRPLAGPHLVRSDGHVSLDFYGDVQIAGLTRREAKVAIVNHLRKFMTDESLGLIEMISAGMVRKRSDPADTDRVYIDDMSEMSAAGDPRANPQNPQAAPASYDRRLSEIELKLDRLIRAAAPARPADAGADAGTP